ncbi:MAG TPA: hypothetical protein VGU43_00555 [Thermoplasmata archaeon]|nr:hypothetical protein [Thermoplasmata archaeon]
MGHLRAATIVHGAGGRPGAPELAPDEDLFTLIVAAGERLLDSVADERDARPESVTCWGELPPSGLEELGLALELAPTPVKGTGEGTAELAHRLAEPTTRPALHLTASATAGGGARSVALLLTPTGEGGIELSGQSADTVEGSEAELPAVELAEALVRTALSGAERSLLVPGSGLALRSVLNGGFGGERTWSRTASTASPLAASAPTLGPAEMATVSEGAYLPAATYREELPSRWRFEAIRCGRCSKVSFPSRGRCAHCGELQVLARFQLPRSGVVEAVTTVRPGAQPSEFDFQVQRAGAYDVLLVRLHPEVRVTLQLTDSAPGVLHIGDRVGSALRRLYPMEGAWRYGRKAVPAESG